MPDVLQGVPDHRRRGCTIFGFDQADRLLRESWTADDLAQELYAMFGPNVPSDTLSTVSITPPTGSQVAPITIGNTPNGGQVLQIRGPSGQAMGTITINNGALYFDNGGGPMPIGAGAGGGGVPVWG